MNTICNQFYDKKILIIGGAGFIGSNLVEYFQNTYEKIDLTVFDLFNNAERWESGNSKSFGTYENLLNFKGRLICGDINLELDFNKLSERKFDFIFHLAAISDTTVYDENAVLRTNLNSFEKIIQLAIANNSPLIYASSGAVYGNSKSPQTVGFESPANVYGFSKLMMDRQVMNIVKSKSNKLSIIGLRFFNVYGKNEFGKGKTSSMVLQFGLQLLKNQRAILFENSDKIFRDFVYIEDIIQGIVKAAISNKSGIYNLGSGIARSFQDIVDILSAELNIASESTYIPNPHLKNYQFHTLANIESTILDLKYTPQYSLEEGIRSYAKEILHVYKKTEN